VPIEQICSVDAMVVSRTTTDAEDMSQPVLAVIDPASEDVAPASLGLMLARLTSTPLLLASAYPVDSASADHTAAAREVAVAAIRRIEALAEQAASELVRIATALVPFSGSPANALHELAEREVAGMLVIGSSQRGQLGRVLPGAVTDRLLHGAPCPVAVAPKGFSFADAVAGPRLIGAAFIDTPAGHAALARACTLASRARALVRVLTVSEPPNPVVTGMLDPLAMEQVRTGQRNAVESVLARGLDAVRVGRSAGGEILSGQPAEALAAASQDLDILVCGSCGLGPVRSILLGSTSHSLVRKAACPVLIVPARATVGAPARTSSSGVNERRPTSRLVKGPLG
jgi:nucleotide-binding universal stress UspA family protein